MTLFATLLRPLCGAPSKMVFAAPLVIAFKKSACFLPQSPVSHLNVFPDSRVTFNSPAKWNGQSPVRGAAEPDPSGALLADLIRWSTCGPPPAAAVPVGAEGVGGPGVG